MKTEEMEALLKPYFRYDDHIAMAKEIANSCRSIAKSPDGRSWLPEFFAGTHVTKACETAWDIHTLTRETVRFVFNGTEIVMEDPLP